MNESDKQKLMLDDIRDLRSDNNMFWMQIVAIALKHAPDEVKPIMHKIALMDRAINRGWEELAK